MYFLEHELFELCADRDNRCLSGEFEAALVNEIELLVDIDPDVGAAVNTFEFGVNKAAFELITRIKGYILRTGVSQAST